MRRASRLLVVSLAALALALIPRAARAQVPTPHADLHHMFAQLGLTDDQKTQLHALHAKMGEQEKSLREAVHAAQKQFADGLQGGTSDDSLRSAHEQLAKAREALMAFRFDGMLAVRKILTADQNKKFAELYIDNHVKRGNTDEE